MHLEKKYLTQSLVICLKKKKLNVHKSFISVKKILFGSKKFLFVQNKNLKELMEGK